MSILDKIVQKTKERVSNLNVSEIKKNVFNSSFEKKSFKGALYKGDIKIIAEIKKASPSKGLICEDFDYLKIAQEYKIADVDCISVLTEPYFFYGDNSYIKNVKEISQKPVLRKDFIIDEVQIYEAKLIGADCILLICAILDEEKLKKFLKLASELELDVLVEAHNEDEIKMALNAKAEIIGVNNRNLKTFEVDIQNAINLRKMVPSDVIFVSESGIKDRKDILLLEKNNVDAVLIGETFMRSNDKVSLIKSLRGQI